MDWGSWTTNYNDPNLWADQSYGSYDQPSYGWGDWTDPGSWGTDLTSAYQPSYDYGQPTQTMPDVGAFEQGGPPVSPEFGTPSQYGAFDYGQTEGPAATTFDYGQTDLGAAGAPGGYEDVLGRGTPPTVPTPPGTPGQTPPPKPGESWLDKAIRLAGSPAAGTLLRAGIGAGGVGLVGAGLATKTPTLKVPPRTLTLSPQEQAAANAMATARAKASGSISDRGYAGEEGIRNEVNKKIQAALTGNYDQVSPYTVRRVEDARRQLQDRLRAELGPGFFTSTAGQNAIENFERNARELLQDESDKNMATLNAAGMQRSGFARQLEMDPFSMAQVEFQSLAPIAGQQQNLAYQTDLGNLQAALAKKQGLLQTGGLMTGVAAAPYLYRPRAA